jgi:hypothetical protein
MASSLYLLVLGLGIGLFLQVMVLPAPLRHVTASAFASALPPIYACLIPLLTVAFLLALILKEIPLRTAARLDAAQALTGHPAPARRASGRAGSCW